MSEESDSSLILDASPLTGRVFGVSSEKPVSPIVIKGKVNTTPGKEVKTRDIQTEMERIKSEGDAFAQGAAEGFRLAREVFTTKKEQFAAFADSFVHAEMNMLDRTSLGRSLGPIRVRAISNMDDFFNPEFTTENTLPSFQSAKRKSIDKAFKYWSNLPKAQGQDSTREEFMKLGRDLRDIKQVENLAMRPGVRLDNIERSKLDGKSRAWRMVATEEENKPGYHENFWYLQKSYA